MTSKSAPAASQPSSVPRIGMRLWLTAAFAAVSLITAAAVYLFGDNGKATASSGVDVRSIGNTGRLRADGSLVPRLGFDRSDIHRVDMRLQRKFRFTNRVAIDGIFEMFNVFNRANFNAWTLNERNANFGKPEQDTNVAYAPRMLQLGFRATF